MIYKGEVRKPLKPYEIAHQGIARTFQNIALFKGMSTLDNIMTGRLTHMKTGMLAQALWWGNCLLYTSPSPRDVEESRMPSSA